jgi:serine/threonine-protein kinase RsbW
MAPATTVRLRIPSEIQLVDLVHDTSQWMAGLAGCGEAEALDMGLAVREAVINAITHGNRSDPRRDVEIVITAGTKQVRAQVRDQGKGFDPADTPDPTGQDNRLKTSGRGLLLIRAFVDQVGFRYREGQGMEVTIIKKVRPSGAERHEAGEARRTGS